MSDITEGESKRVRVLLAAAAVTLVIGACAAAAMARGNDDKPKDPSQAAEEPEPSTTTVPATVTVTIQPAPAWHGERVDAGQAEAALKNRGFLPPLAANQADCLSPNPVAFGDMEPVAGPVDLALTEDLTADLLIESCLDAYHSGQTGPRAAADLCVREGVYPRPVVAIEWTCGEAKQDAWRLRAVTDDDLAKLNAMRAVEVALMANPAECPTADDTVAWTERTLQDVELALQVQVHNDSHMDHGSDEMSEPITCPLLTRVDWDEEVVYVEPFHS